MNTKEPKVVASVRAVVTVAVHQHHIHQEGLMVPQRMDMARHQIWEHYHHLQAAYSTQLRVSLNYLTFI